MNKAAQFMEMSRRLAKLEWLLRQAVEGPIPRRDAMEARETVAKLQEALSGSIARGGWF